MGACIGIDLGTTYSAVAVLRPTGTPEILENLEGRKTTPSVVFFENDEGEAPDRALVGEQAKNLSPSAPGKTVSFVKRFMDDPKWCFESPARETYSAIQISAIILKGLIEDASRELGEEITDVVITVPAYFDDARRAATKQAGELNGVNVLRILNEPTAAAISFGIGKGKDGLSLVYDLGGGTFDVTLLKVDGTEIEVIGTDGDPRLGGKDFDDAIMLAARKAFEDKGWSDIAGDDYANAELREKCEIAKMTLSKSDKATIRMSHEGTTYDFTITRDEFEAITKDLLNQTADLVGDALNEAGVSWADIDHALLIGGSTKMPMVKKLIKELSGKEPEVGVNPDEAVALGAAIQAALEVEKREGTSAGGTIELASGASLSDIAIQDVTSQALGVLVIDNMHVGKMRNSVVIPRNSQIPGSYSSMLATVDDNQQAVHVQVTQGDDSDPEFVTIAGEKTLSIAPHPKGSPIRITYSYDIDQIIHVELTDMAVDPPQSLGTFEIDRLVGMDEQQMALAAAQLDALSVE